jgi:hypothetical protein
MLNYRGSLGGIVTAAEPRRILTAQDRCDKRACNAAAYVRVFYETGSLSFCGHHWFESPETLLLKSMYHLDETWAI